MKIVRARFILRFFIGGAKMLVVLFVLNMVLLFVKQGMLLKGSKRQNQSMILFLSILFGLLLLLEYSYSFEKLRANARNGLMAVGVIGGALIFHGFRYNNQYKANHLGVPFGWYWSPHFHCVGFILGGYVHCRNCKKVKDSDYGKPCEAVCAGCSGFESRVRKYGAKHDCDHKDC